MKHLFILNNTITQLLCTLVIKRLSLEEEDVLIIYLRSSAKIFESLSKYTSLFFVNANTFSSHDAQYLLNDSTSYHLYIPHNGEKKSIYRQLSNLSKCIKVSYLEEGTLSYSKTVYTSTYRTVLGFPLSSIPFIAWITRKKRFDSNRTFHCISDKCFPFLRSKGQKIVYSEFIELIKEYKPNATPHSIIISVNPRNSIPKMKWLIKQIKARYSRDLFIKTHPSLSSSKYATKLLMLSQHLKEESISILKSNTFLEFEMIFNSCIIIGTKSSLSIYSSVLDTHYIRFDKPNFFERLDQVIFIK